MTWELLLFMAGAAAIFVGCLVPAHWLLRLPNDKFLHFAAFAVMAFLAARIAQDRMELLRWVAGLFLAGLLIEILQDRVPGRKFCWRDLMANTAGLVFAALGYQFAFPK
jgi:VanZ family protein